MGKAQMIKRVTLKWAWYDLWVGLFIDTAKKRVYICPLPTILITIHLKD